MAKLLVPRSKRDAREAAAAERSLPLFGGIGLGNASVLLEQPRSGPAWSAATSASKRLRIAPGTPRVSTVPTKKRYSRESVSASMLRFRSPLIASSTAASEGFQKYSGSS